MKRRIVRDILILALVVIGVGFWQTKDLVSSGEMAPALTGPVLGGGTFSLADVKGRPALVYFFAPWCSVCKLSARNAVWIRKLLPQDKIVIAAVALDYESEASIDEFVRSAEIDGIPVVRGDDTIRDSYKVGAYPTYYVIDAEGRVQSKSVGYSTLFGMLFRAFFA